MNIYNEPLLIDIECYFCGHKWTGFFPNGIKINMGRGIECPKCYKEGGFASAEKEKFL